MANVDYGKYYSRGAHAYDVPARALPKRTPQPKPQVTPRKKRQPERSIVIKMGISKYTLLLLMAIFACAFMAVYYVAAVQYNNRQIRIVRSEITETQRQITNTRSVINGSYNLAEVEAAAERLGLARPEPHQQIRVYLSR